MSADRPAAAAVLQMADGVTVLAIILTVGSLNGFAISFSVISTPMALFVDFGLIACGLSTWAHPTNCVLTGVLSFEFSLVALPGANLSGFLIGTVLGGLPAWAYPINTMPDYV